MRASYPAVAPRSPTGFLPFLILIAIIGTWHVDAPAQVFYDEPIGTSTGQYYDTAFGDVDQDGDMDMVMAAGLWMGLLFFPNTPGRDPYSPGHDPYLETSWRRDVARPYFRTIALGDLDGDGDLDIACTRHEQSVELYMYENGGFQYSPRDTSTERRNRESIALGDIDGDGDLDIICGNGNLQYGLTDTSTLYLNRSEPGSDTILAPTPDWRSDIAGVTSQMELGDLDGDDDLDLVCVDGAPGSPGRISIYRNHFDEDVSTVYHPRPDSLTGLNTMAALGDIDGDGDLDLVSRDSVGFLVVLPNIHDETATLIYDTEAAPAWKSPEPVPDNRYFKPVLGDLDGDGDLDLCCLATSGNFQIFLNRGLPTLFPDQPDQELTADGFDSATLVDVNGNGGLDLVCYGAAPVRNPEFGIYLNTGVAFAVDPVAVHPFVTEATRSVALCDIDGDGWLDLVSGADGRTAVFRNGEGTFESNLHWSVTDFDTRAVALGRVNGDEFPDLVCGNHYGANTVYLNDAAGNLSSYPGWNSMNSSARTTSIALGDVDGDGWTDLVCGNGDQPNWFYRNENGRFSDWGEQISEEAHDTRSVALGDMDGDGDLDLVCGDYDLGNSLYLNREGEFEPAITWQSYWANPTLSVALGDVDGDGFLDLVCGNDLGTGVTLYSNSNGQMSLGWGTGPDWTSSDTSSTHSVLLKDFDGDGDLDLLCGNHDAPDALYRNIDGAFADPPFWLSGPADATTSLALGDLDRDGDPELVCGNLGQGDTVYKGLRDPAFKHDPVSPTDHLVNTDAYLTRVGTECSVNAYRVSFTATDPEADVVWVLPEYRFEDMPDWHVPMIPGHPAGTSVGPLDASPTGVLHEISWDFSQLDFDARNVVLRLRTGSSVGTVGVTTRVTNYQHEVGPLDIHRSEVAVAADSLRFPRVTLGDNVWAVLEVVNVGNEPLAVSGITLPFGEMRHAGPESFTVPPRESHIDTLWLEPRTETDCAGEVVIQSDATRNPFYSIPVQAEILPLQVRTLPFVVGDTAPLGGDLTVQVIPAEYVHVERCALHYRPAAGSGPFASIEMARSEETFIMLIPGPDVVEGGLEYFVELENSGVFATDPPDTAGGTFHFLEVAVPEEVSSYPNPNSDIGFLENRPVWIEAILPGGARFASGTLHYRPGGEPDYRSLDLEQSGPLPAASIPGSACGPRGLEYWVEVRTSSDIVLTDPPARPSVSPRTLVIGIQDLQEQVTAPAGVYRMVSIPLQFGEEFTGTLEALLADQSSFGSYAPTRWRSYRWQPSLDRYVELSEEDHAAEFRPQPGRAFWLVCRSAARIETAPITGSSTPTDGVCAITLQPGWNQVGNPFTFPVAWDSCLVDGLPMAQADTLVQGPVGWDGERYDLDVTDLEVFAGYWVRNLTTAGITLGIPPHEAPDTKIAGHGGDQVPWEMSIGATCGAYGDRTNLLGVAPDAAGSWDARDVFEPPAGPGRSLSVYFPHLARPHRAGYFTTDFRAAGDPNDGGDSWLFDVAKNFAEQGVGDEVTLGFEGLATVPPELGIVLVDHALDHRQDLRESGAYSFFCGARERVPDDDRARFELLVGTDAWLAGRTGRLPDLPTSTTLYQNRPNPFNPATVIRFDAARDGDAELRIYDLTGALVRTIHAGHVDHGGHEFAWDGTDDRGARVASGVYVYRIRTSWGYTKTKKLTLLK